MQRSRIPFLVQAIKPHAVYQGEVYTQYVEVSTQSESFRILDADLLITDKHIGKEIESILMTFSISQNHKQPGEDRRIEVGENMEVVRLLGKVVGVDIERKAFLLNVGIGTIECNGIDVESIDIRVKVGDFVVHNPRRIDLRGIY
jgi:hypothetical protein